MIQLSHMTHGTSLGPEVCGDIEMLYEVQLGVYGRCEAVGKDPTVVGRTRRSRTKSQLAAMVLTGRVSGRSEWYVNSAKHKDCMVQYEKHTNIASVRGDGAKPS